MAYKMVLKFAPRGLSIGELADFLAELAEMPVGTVIDVYLLSDRDVPVKYILLGARSSAPISASIVRLDPVTKQATGRFMQFPNSFKPSDSNLLLCYRVELAVGIVRSHAAADYLSQLNHLTRKISETKALVFGNQSVPGAFSNFMRMLVDAVANSGDSRSAHFKVLNASIFARDSAVTLHATCRDYSALDDDYLETISTEAADAGYVVSYFNDVIERMKRAVECNYGQPVSGRAQSLHGAANAVDVAITTLSNALSIARQRYLAYTTNNSVANFTNANDVISLIGTRNSNGTLVFAVNQALTIARTLQMQMNALVAEWNKFYEFAFEITPSVRNLALRLASEAEGNALLSLAFEVAFPGNIQNANFASKLSAIRAQRSSFTALADWRDVVDHIQRYYVSKINPTVPGKEEVSILENILLRLESLSTELSLTGTAAFLVPYDIAQNLVNVETMCITSRSEISRFCSEIGPYLIA